MNGVESHGQNENIERMLKRFKRLTESTGILAEVKDKLHYNKPSVIKRKKFKDAIRKAQKDRQYAQKEEFGIGDY